MKTAEEWLKQAAATNIRAIADTNCDMNEACVCDRCKNGMEIFLLPADIEAIQLDAYRAGMERAASMMVNKLVVDHGGGFCGFETTKEKRRNHASKPK